MRRTLWLAAALFTLSGCRGAVTRDEVVGRYQLNRGSRRYELQVRADGHWIQRLPGSQAAADSGTWTWDAGEQPATLTFNNFTHRWRREFAPNDAVRTGFWSVVPQRSIRGGVVLPLDEDIDLSFVER